MSGLYTVLMDRLESCLVCILSSWTDLSHVWFVCGAGWQTLAVTAVKLDSSPACLRLPVSGNCPPSACRFRFRQSGRA